MQTKITKRSNLFKLAPFLLSTIFLIASFGCSNTSSDDDINPVLIAKNAFISYSLSGPIINGDFKIEYIPSPTVESPGNAIGINTQYIEGEPQKSIVFYSDSDQDLSVNIVFLSEKATFMFGDNEENASMSLYHQNTGYLKSGSITISEIKYENFSILSKLAVKGSFQGIFEHFDSGTNTIVNHDISGKFEFDNY